MNIQLRPLRVKDANDLAQHANNPSVANNLTDQFPHPYKLDNAVHFINKMIQSAPPHVLCIEVDGSLVGAIGIHAQDDVWRNNAELGYWLAEPFWGKGIMTEAIKNIVEYGFQNFEINRIFARPFGRNIASQRALEKAGFQHEVTLKGTIIKNDQVEDEVIYAVRK
jgi:[ribosomal protein S5]-alanine N-acetyltransferase